MIDFPINSLGSEGSSVYDSEEREKVRIGSVSIKTVLKEFNINQPYLLDLDIKGKEFEVIEDKSISEFRKIRIEYSPYFVKDGQKTLRTLMDKLKEQGFGNFRIYKHYYSKYELSKHGTIE